MRLQHWLILAALIGSASADPDPRTLRERLGSEDPAVRKAASEEVIASWEELSEEVLAELSEIAEGGDPEAAAAARALTVRVEARRTYGPWLADRAAAMASEVAAGHSTVDGELEWAAAEWIQGRASEAELGRFLDRAWEIGKGCPRFSAELQQATWSVRPYARVFEDWVVSSSAEDPDLVRKISSVASSDDPSRWRCLVPWLQAKDDEVRYAALDGLQRLGAAGAAPEVAKRLEDPEVRIRRETVTTLAAFGAREFTGAVRERLADPEPEVLAAALDALGRWRDVDSAPAIEKLAGSGACLREAAFALGRMGRLLPESVKRQALWMFDEKDPEFLAAIFGDRLSAHDRKVLLHVAASGEEARRARAIEVLRVLLKPEDYLELRPWILDQVAELRRELLPGFECMPRAERLEFFRPLLADDDPTVRGIAAIVMAADRNAAEDIARLLDSAQDETVWAATIGLMILGDTKAAPRLRRFLDDGDDRQLTAIRYAKAVDLREWAPELRRIATGGTQWNAERARDTLIDWSTAEDADWLKELLSAADEGARWNACRRLLELGQAGRVRDWLSTEHDPDGVLPERVQRAMLESGDRDLAKVVMAQPAWLDTQEMVVTFREPWVRAMAELSPQAFETLPPDLRKLALRRLRNLRASPYLDVEMLSEVALIRLGALSGPELLAVLDKTRRDEPVVTGVLILTRRGYADSVHTALNAAVEPASWRRLHAPFVTAQAVDSAESLAVAASQIGLDLDPGSEVLGKRTGNGRTVSLAELLHRHLSRNSGVVLEGNKVRLVPRAGLADYWYKRLHP